MFTGLVASTGTVEAAGARLRIATPLTAELERGDSIAVGGVCLTAVAIENGTFEADVMEETLKRSSLGSLKPGDPVNLELALRVGDRLGGHFVQGHVDATGTVESVEPREHSTLIGFAAPADVLRYMVEKGSIAVDGVSLTVVNVGERSFSVSLIPETLERTTLGALEPGDLVNLEADMLAKYVVRQ
jgi:riboflavin synthase